MKKRFGSVRKRRETLDIDITSLLDILVILLVFLLKSYNPADLKLELAKGLKLPDSQSVSYGSNSVMVQVSVDKEIYLNSNKIGILQGSDEKIDVLFDELDKLKKVEEAKIAEIPSDSISDKDLKVLKESNQKINIVLDKSLNYGVLRKVMHTAALAGYPKFKFIVQGQYQ